MSTHLTPCFFKLLKESSSSIIYRQLYLTIKTGFTIPLLCLFYTSKKACGLWMRFRVGTQRSGDVTAIKSTFVGFRLLV